VREYNVLLLFVKVLGGERNTMQWLYSYKYGRVHICRWKTSL